MLIVSPVSRGELMYIQGDRLTNASLRKRFGVKDSLTGSISRLIKPLDSDTIPRYMRHIHTSAKFYLPP